ncbi:UDP-N-acetylmuramoyl-tripeptide--D-alanyl-D-alanine ligase [Nakamurella panacisegetis]|uniref:UDP-N-acetylmuramoyl-tripeptide--D-alanyl-D-alanine ligase n=1 Tax=Nakamurella panacisegetis TaxID=1090615 RepID=A0A1H0Q8A0_9ACTN|nr:UDP-N-acetylmuramoyl-tripeptide--D-alanyl-D-alanine ligase [Nakamurella panacisegetis]SDP13631.1 UDP-N-acetylmuramoyl-tripeptide--D-alanyl-D-alanine ligase [Nakamurella panacisegetis]
MIAMTVREIATAIGVTPPAAGGDAVVTSVEFDTRRVTSGALFVALVGERVDGHDFAETARQAGAVAVLGSKETPGSALPLLRVADNDAVLEALSVLAGVSVAALVERTGLTVVGVTGSAGKTSTKDMIAAVLRAGTGGGSETTDAEDQTVIAPPESFNNELGHPYTALRATERTRFLVLELSARGIGHIATLARSVPLLIGAVLNVGTAHIGEFGTVDAIARAKGELVEALPSADAGGVAILNADDPRVRAMAPRTTAAVVTVGTGPDVTVRARDVVTDPQARAHFTLVTPEGSAPVALTVVGAHQVSNALTAAAVGRAVGLTVEQVAGALSAATAASKWRMEITERADGVTVVNDAYNANPDSMKAALQALAVIGEHRRTWAVLGEMAELGPLSQPAHDEIGRLVVRLGVDRLIVVGQRARALHLGAHLEGSWGGESEIVDDLDAALVILRRDLEPGDVVLVKASRSVGLDRVAAAVLAELAAPLPGDTPPTSSIQQSSNGQESA